MFTAFPEISSGIELVLTVIPSMENLSDHLKDTFQLQDQKKSLYETDVSQLDLLWSNSLGCRIKLTTNLTYLCLCSSSSLFFFLLVPLSNIASGLLKVKEHFALY